MILHSVVSRMAPRQGAKIKTVLIFAQKSRENPARLSRSPSPYRQTGTAVPAGSPGSEGAGTVLPCPSASALARCFMVISGGKYRPFTKIGVGSLRMLGYLSGVQDLQRPFGSTAFGGSFLLRCACLLCCAFRVHIRRPGIFVTAVTL